MGGLAIRIKPPSSRHHNGRLPQPTCFGHWVQPSVRAPAALLVSLSLWGCTTLPTDANPVPVTAPDAAKGTAAATTVTTVDLVTALSGRLSLRVRRPSDGSTDGGSLLFEFEGGEARGTLLLNTPIGTTVARATWTPEGAEIVTAQGRRTGARLDDVAGTLLGQALPMAALLRWIRAEPWPGAPSTPAAQGFEQLGWTVSLESWHEGVVTAHRAASPLRPQDHEITVRVRLDAPTAVPP